MCYANRSMLQRDKHTLLVTSASLGLSRQHRELVYATTSSEPISHLFPGQQLVKKHLASQSVFHFAS